MKSLLIIAALIAVSLAARPDGCTADASPFNLNTNP